MTAAAGRRARRATDGAADRLARRAGLAGRPRRAARRADRGGRRTGSAGSRRTSRAAVPAGAVRLPGLTLPGLANAHSHAFHRALRGITQAGRGTFWTWRERMYEVAARLDPDSYLALATAVYAEMALAGITCVGEFHYLHHGPDGVPLRRPERDGPRAGRRRRPRRAPDLPAGHLLPVRRAAPDGEDCRWPGRSSGSATATPSRWADRVARARRRPARRRAARPGRRRDPLASAPCRAASCRRSSPGRTRTARRCTLHLSEQPAENVACLAAYGGTPAGLLDEAGALGPRTTAVHATHLPTATSRCSAAAGPSPACAPPPRRDLADGIGPARALARPAARSPSAATARR